MTIPTLIANYQSKSWGTAAEVFERKLNEALRTMNTQQSLAGYTTTEDFVAELSKHFKILKTCDNTKLGECFSTEVTYGNELVDMTKVKTSKHFGQDEWDTNIVGVQFANGTNALIAYNPITSSNDATVSVCKQDPYSNQVSVGNCLAILYDTSGYKSPNTSGKDLRANANVKKLGGANCAFEVGDACFTMPVKADSAHVWNACDKTTYTSTDPDDLAYMQKYGLTSCYPNNDYFAKAAETCGGISKMATAEDLVEIGRLVYGTDVINGAYDSGKRKWEDLTVSVDPSTFGFPSLPSNEFYIWSNVQVSDPPYRVYYMFFIGPQNYAGWEGTYRGNDSSRYGWTLCKGE